MLALQARALWPVVAAIEPESQAVLRDAGVPASMLEGPGRLARARSDALWKAAIRRSDPRLPLRIAAGVGPRTYGHFTYLLGASPTVGDTLRSLCRHYTGLLGNTTEHRLEGSRRRVVLSIDTLGARPACIDLFSVAVVASFLRGTAEVRPVRVSVGQALDGCKRPEIQAFFGCPVDDGVLSLTFAAKDLEVPLRGADPQLRDVLEEHAHWRSETATTMRARVEAGLEAHGLSPRLRAADIAQGLGTSVRTLRRRLAAESTSFQAVLDDLLRNAALEHLCRGTVDDAARALGYADGAALRRAHRRWFGTSPRGLTAAASQSR